LSTTIVLNMTFATNNPLKIKAKFLSIGLLIALAVLVSRGSLAQTENNSNANAEISATDTTAESLETPNRPEEFPSIHPPSLLSLKKEHDKLLDNEINSGEVKWIDTAAGQDTEGNDSKFLALWRPDATGNPYGALLLLHGDGQTADAPGTINPIRENLSLFGWATLAISLPTPKGIKIPRRPVPSTTPEDQTEELKTDTETPSKKELDTSLTNQLNAPPDQTPTTGLGTAAERELPPRDDKTPDASPEEITKTRIDAALKFLKEQGQYNVVVVAQGAGGVRAMKYIDQLMGQAPQRSIHSSQKTTKKLKIQRPIRAAILIAARNTIEENDENITQFFNDAALPILDIYFSDHFLDTIESKARIKAAREKGLSNYHQIKLARPATDIIEVENNVTRRIRGFLNRYARGFEVGR
jgi:hypothetical protein